MKNDISEMLPYNFSVSENKWNGEFEKSNLYSKDSLRNNNKPKYYVLEMFPYPSGKIHMGHVRNYTFGDIIARYKRLKGFNVLHPIGWDAFGLPAENAALERNVLPKAWTYQNIDNMRSQLKKLGFSYNWDLEFATCDPKYYAYQQKIFIQLYKKGYIYKKHALVNWDPVDNCVLANEQVIDGRGWRSGAVVEQRKLNQWFMRITDFADELLDDLKLLPGWPEKVKTMQENWIGRSEGLVIKFTTNDSKHLEVFSTRADTLYGATFIAISAEHDISQNLAKTNERISNFINECKQGSVSTEFVDKLDKKGIDTGLTAINPINSDVLPIYITNFVLSGHGTGAIFGTPAHDTRDYDFAKAYGLPIKQVVAAPGTETVLPYIGSGVMVNSGILNGLNTSEARAKISDILEQKGIASRKVMYRLRDWGLSRQRYWGCPIPIIKCEKCGNVPCPENELPVILPDDITFDKTGNPLDWHPTWKYVKCPVCNGNATRETDTMDTFVDSSWYFMHFCQKAVGDGDLVNNPWLPVDQYIGGVEHAILHLLYARFFTKLISKEVGSDLKEPFRNLLTQGMVGHVTYKREAGSWLYPEEVMLKNGEYVEIKTGQGVTVGRSEKMSKSKRNVVDPDKIISDYGADSVRLFVVSDTPPEKDFDWSSDGLDGCWRFVNRIWRLFSYASKAGITISDDTENWEMYDGDQKSFVTDIHKSLKEIDDALESNGFNKAVASIRNMVNVLYDNLELLESDRVLFGKSLRILAIVISPFMPYLAEEVWHLLGGTGFVALQKWPDYSEAMLKDESITIPVQVNGKLRANIVIPIDAQNDCVLQIAMNNEKIRQLIADKEVRKKIYIKNKIVNLVV